MDHSANVALAIDFGAETALFFNNMAFWTHKNLANKHHFYEGRYWVYNSYSAFKTIFPYFSIQTIRRIIRNAVRDGLLIIGNFNKKGYDNTNWYSLTDKALSYFPTMFGTLLNTPVDSNMTLVDSNRPIPDSKQQILNNIISDFKKSPEPEVDEKEILDAYHEVLPDNPRIRVVDRKLRQQLKAIQHNWSSYTSDGKPFSIESFRKYLMIIKEHYSWFIKPYRTSSGAKRINSLRNLTTQTNIAKILNGEFTQDAY